MESNGLTICIYTRHNPPVSIDVDGVSVVAIANRTAFLNGTHETYKSILIHPIGLTRVRRVCQELKEV